MLITPLAQAALAANQKTATMTVMQKSWKTNNFVLNWKISGKFPSKMTWNGRAKLSASSHKNLSALCLFWIKIEVKGNVKGWRPVDFRVFSSDEKTFLQWWRLFCNRWSRCRVKRRRRIGREVPSSAGTRPLRLERKTRKMIR